MRRLRDDLALRCLVVYLSPLWLLLAAANLEAFGVFDLGIVADQARP